MVTAAMKLKHPCSLEESYDQHRQHIIKQRHYLANKGPHSQSYVCSISQVWIWELDHKEGWVSKNWCFWIVVLEKTLESPLDYKEVKPISPKRNQSWIFIGRTDAEAETPILWPHVVKRWLTGKDPGKDGRQEEKGATENEMVEWYHWLNGNEFGQALGNGEGQGRLACCSPWVCKKSDMTGWLKNNNSFESVKWKWKSLSCVWLVPWIIVHGILQAKIMEWVDFPFSRGSSQPRDQTQVSCIAGGFFTNWATTTSVVLTMFLEY